MGQGLRDGSLGGTSVDSEYHFYHDPDGEDSLTPSILSALAALEDVDVDELPVALHDYVDTDALDQIVAPKLDGTPREDSRVDVDIPDYRITIHGDGQVVVTDRTD